MPMPELMQSPLPTTRPSTIKTRHRGAASHHESAGAASRRESAGAASSTPSESGAASSSESGGASSAPAPGLCRPGQLDRYGTRTRAVSPTSDEFAHLATGAGDYGLSCVEADDKSRSKSPRVAAASAKPRAASFCGAPCTLRRSPPPRTTLSTRQRVSSRSPNMVLRYRALPAVIEPAERENRVSLKK
ncbi:hypothetical protein M885DRAFT_515143, partial [Pelagophyceae sp. CCMP2097]